MLDLMNPLAAFRLDGEVAIVTGGANGLGRAIGTALAGAGAIVVLADHDAPAARIAAEEIALAGGRVEARALDVTDEQAIVHVFEAVVAAHGRLDMLINNAGIGTAGGVRQESADGFELRFAVNYLAGFLLTRLLLPLLEASAPARIVNVSSAGQQAIDFADVMLIRGYSGARAYCQS
jgi:NAD(P)-dependent dehydrogenase (short-subunit alcohol dehydrogenase family)